MLEENNKNAKTVSGRQKIKEALEEPSKQISSTDLPLKQTLSKVEIKEEVEKIEKNEEVQQKLIKAETTSASSALTNTALMSLIERSRIKEAPARRVHAIQHYEVVVPVDESEHVTVLFTKNALNRLFHLCKVDTKDIFQ